ncbi:uncharacterized protein N7484_009821 [Penicillium longicatenatum]|uniref:uncharacterized protein n=1 Tax=Penicillium longicatenatum TaxID=1561947 RepID=UPI002547B79F|nr:uncharacterized protein N7484_009821 [Penicillium longicatenatum]KAJ5636508.1 hypothetical protein N7484_009821 [Penicillium longicatenatum]
MAQQCQADQFGQKWYEAAARNQIHAGIARSWSLSTLGVERQHPEQPTVPRNVLEPGKTRQVLPSDGSTDRTELPDVHISPTLSQLNPPSWQGPDRLVTNTMLREDQSPWLVSQNIPAIISVPNGSDDQHILELRSFSESSFNLGPGSARSGKSKISRHDCLTMNT